ncbi:protein-tyrosine phosphatase-like protein [Chlamydoabsidia padenii]|nr:protein-tyrosine phosphatase-like protein [Chlamydoabsidia padenii]
MATTPTPPLGHMVSVIHHEQVPIRFLIMDCPTENTLSFYITTLRQHGVSTVVRCCQETYDADSLLEQGFDFMDLPFRDGGVPSRTKLDEWMGLVEKHKNQLNRMAPPTIAVHCVAGLGRAPVLVALALIELGLSPREAVGLIRQKRRGALNRSQRLYLDLYGSKKKHRINNNDWKQHQRYYSSTTGSTKSSSSIKSWGGRLFLKLTQRISPHRQHSI